MRWEYVDGSDILQNSRSEIMNIAYGRKTKNIGWRCVVVETGGLWSGRQLMSCD
jgi:hypothetical protein